MTTNMLDTFFATKTYDIRASRNGRWIDQKCTHDVVNFVADCICYYVENGGVQPFESPTIWRSDYAVQYVQEAFGKPYPLDEEPHDEFNKFFRQPMKMLAAAGVLKEAGVVRNTIQFQIADREMLDYIALRPWNAQKFIERYVTKTLEDSGLWPVFSAFYKYETQETLDEAKSAFEQFCYAYTPINNKKETGRIFTKVLNPLSFANKKHGTVSGRLSKNIITLADVTYNRTNFRDNKDKNVARRAHIAITGNPAATAEYRIAKQMKMLKQFNTEYRHSKSEVVDLLALNAAATQAHHIFPKSKYPEIAAYAENLIMLTSGQHYEKAHPSGKTQEVDRGYQFACLMYKLKSIKENLTNDFDMPVIYDMERFKKVLGIGLQTDYFELIDPNSYEAIGEGIKLQYSPAEIAQYAGIAI